MHLEDITVTEITDASANVAWTISSVSSQQVYYLEYGEDSNDLDQMTYSTQSSSDTTLTDESYDIYLTDLTNETTYYIQVVQIIGDVIILSDVFSFTTLAPADPGKYRIVGIFCMELIFAFFMMKRMTCVKIFRICVCACAVQARTCIVRICSVMHDYAKIYHRPH